MYWRREREEAETLKVEWREEREIENLSLIYRLQYKKAQIDGKHTGMGGKREFMPSCLPLPFSRSPPPIFAFPI